MPNANSDQGERRVAIRELLGRGPVATQQLLVTELARRGFAATQSSVSRDLREIGAIKTARGYELEPEDVAEKPELNAIGEFVRAILPAGPHLRGPTVPGGVPGRPGLRRAAPLRAAGPVHRVHRGRRLPPEPERPLPGVRGRRTAGSGIDRRPER